MSVEIDIIKPALLLLFSNGKTETEAYEEISKSHSSYPISLKVVGFWFKKFRSGDDSLGNKKKRGPKPKLTDEFLTSLINENPEFNIAQLSKLAGVSTQSISNRIKRMNFEGDKPCYINKKSQNGTIELTDESLIKLVKENPSLNTYELAKIADSSQSTIVHRLKQINRNGEGVNYINKKSHIGTTNLTDESLIKLIRENPGFGTYELAKIADSSQATISYRLKRINKNSSSDQKIILQKGNKKSYKARSSISSEFLINLINENPKLNMAELAKLADSSTATISRHLKKINGNGKMVNYNSKRSQSGTEKLTDKTVINLVNENPGLDTFELAKLANTSQSTIRRRLNKINSDGEKVNYKYKYNKNPTTKLTNDFIINHINDNPGLNLSAIAKLANISTSTLSLRIKQINTEGKEICNIRKFSKGKPPKITDKILINLVNENPNLNMSELGRLANVSTSSISRKLKQINEDEESAYFTNQLKRKSKKFTDEFLINLINENPNLNMSELAKLANTSQSTISRRLKIINSHGERVKYINK
jgi:DeoR/GlpR family transcriptional regulator of sugar metabolism